MLILQLNEGFLQQLADLLADSGLNATASLLLDIAALPSMQEATAARRRSLQPDMGSGPRSGPAGTAAMVVDPTTAKAPGPLDPSHWSPHTRADYPVLDSFEWVGDWTIDRKAGDADGFEYAFDFWSAFAPASMAMAMVRRRRWIRTMQPLME